MDTPKPHQAATAQELAEHGANAQAYAEDAPNSAIDDALARILGNPPAAECPIMVLLVDDQAIIAEAVRQALADEATVHFHYSPPPEKPAPSPPATHPTLYPHDHPKP